MQNPLDKNSGAVADSAVIDKNPEGNQSTLSPELVKEKVDLLDAAELKATYRSPVLASSPQAASEASDAVTLALRGCPNESATVSCVANVTSKKTASFNARAIIAFIRSTECTFSRNSPTTLAAHVRLIRETYAKAGGGKAGKVATKNLKEQLPAVMWSGKFSDAHKPVADKLVRHSGLICADLDELGDKLHDTRVALLNSPYLWAVFLSPSGDGLKAIFCVPACTPREHKHCVFPYMKMHVMALTGVEVDESCSDIGRLCYESHDPDAMEIESAIEMPVNFIIEDEPTEKKRGFRASKETVRSMLAALPVGAGRDRPDYDTWLRVIGAVGDALDECDALEVLSEWSPEEREGEYQAKLDSDLNKVSVSTLYYMALENGWRMSYEPPPLDLLPPYLQDYISAESEAANVDTGFVLLPLLSSLGAMIGNSRSILLKSGYAEPPIIWTGLIAGSGEGKSPALRAATYMHGEFEKILITQNRAAKEAFENEKAVWNARGRKEVPPKPPVQSACLMDDLTMEALAVRLVDNPRGMLVEKDELSQWFASFDQYRDGKGGDVSKWLSLWSGTRIAIDRKNSPSIRIMDPRVCLTGGIQPGVLKRALTQDFFERGLVARFILAAPPKRKRLWQEGGASETRRHEAYENLLPLWALQAEDGFPKLLPVSGEAKDRYTEFYNECAEQREHIKSGRYTAFLAKLPAQAARLALIGQLAHEPAAVEVRGYAVEAACELARWIGRETQRIYMELAETKEQREERELVAFIKRKGGEVSVRELARGPRRYRNAQVAEDALEDLVRRDIAAKFDDRPTRGPGGAKYRLLEVHTKSSV
jgi:Protein of unknown function (DUF3987)/BT4734-like, N-terminal domain